MSLKNGTCVPPFSRVMVFLLPFQKEANGFFFREQVGLAFSAKIKKNEKKYIYIFVNSRSAR